MESGLCANLGFNHVERALLGWSLMCEVNGVPYKYINTRESNYGQQSYINSWHTCLRDRSAWTLI